MITPTSQNEVQKLKIRVLRAATSPVDKEHSQFVSNDYDDFALFIFAFKHPPAMPSVSIPALGWTPKRDC